jgi:DNA invertase Pin-like site-specific DNA recombinase
MLKAIAYYRANSTMNGAADNFPPQRKAVRAFAKANGMKIVREYLDCGRQGESFATMLHNVMLHEDAAAVVVQDASALGRRCGDLETVARILRERGVKLLTIDGQDLTEAAGEVTAVDRARFIALVMRSAMVRAYWRIVRAKRAAMALQAPTAAQAA